MHEKALSKISKKNLKVLADSGIIDDFYMAGGTAAALYLGHRISLDLDFFTEKYFDNKIIIERLKTLGKLHLEKESWGTIWCILNETKLSLFVYDHPLIAKPDYYKNVRLASLLDIACMKISAISSRGTKRDFIDLYLICKKEFGLKAILEAFKKKYKAVNYNMMHIFKSIMYFDDAEKDPNPKMLIELEWSEVKRFFQQELLSLQKPSY